MIDEENSTFGDKKFLGMKSREKCQRIEMVFRKIFLVQDDILKQNLIFFQRYKIMLKLTHLDRLAKVFGNPTK